MHRLAVGALAGLGLLVGCLGEKTRQCANGATCAFDEACTEVPLDSGQELCGSPGLVDACLDKAEFSSCTFAEPGTPGTCVGKRCTLCTPDLAGCLYPGWRVMSPVGTTRLRAVWVGGPTQAYAVGDQGTVAVYDGRGWQSSQIEQSMSGTLTSVWSDGTTIYVGTTDNGGSVFAGEQVGGALTWSVATSGVPVNAISGSGPNDIVAVGFGGAIVQFDGTVWTPVSSGVVVPIRGVYVVDAQNAWAVGNQGAIVRRQAGTWSVSQMNMVGEKNLNGVWGTAETAYAASDLPAGNTTPRVLQFDGAWSDVVLPSSSPANATSIWGVGTEVFVVGGSGTILHLDGSEWTLQTPGTGQSNIDSIHGSAVDHLMYVGDGGAIARFTGIP